MRKVFAIKGQDSLSWTEKGTSIVGLVIEGETLSITNIKGINVTLEGFLTMLSKIQDEINEVDLSIVNPFQIQKEVGMSGCQTWTMKYLQERGNGFYAEFRKEILYISCFEKLPSQTIYLPGLACILGELLETTPSSGKIAVKEVKEVKLDDYVIPN